LSVERWVLKKLDAEDRIALARLRALKNEVAALFPFFDRLDDVVEIRPFAGFEFGMEQFAIGANFEGAAARRN
jgi:hypothetical protein